MRRWALGVAAAGMVAGLATLIWWGSSLVSPATLKAARRALVERDYARAETLALTVARRPGADPWAWLVAGEAAARAGRLQESLRHYEQVSDGPVELRVSAACGRGEMLLQLGKLESAAGEFRAALELDPDFVLAERRLADLFNLAGRRQRAVPLMTQLIQTSAGSLEDLFYLGDVDHALLQPESAAAAIRDEHADPWLVLGAAIQALAENRGAEARTLCERVLNQRPDDVDAAAALGEALLLAAPDQLAEWRARLSPTALEDAGVAAVLGQLAERESRPEEAARWFARCVAGRPTSRIAWHRFGQSLSRLGRTADAARALERAQRLQQVALWLDDLFAHRTHVELMRRVAEQLVELGRPAEAVGWSRQALSVAPRAGWAAAIVARYERSPQAWPPAEADAALAELLRSLLAEGTVLASASVPRGMAPAVPGSRIRFVENAQEGGIDFIYRAARDPSTPGARILETTGGGVAALDYDGDGWSDLYFTQGGREIPLPPHNPDRDRLYRNRQGTAWEDVSAAAGVDDAQFGQGVAAGDFNNDGFADLYVANYGINRLYQNQGDGTFRDVTPAALRERPVWTSSCAIADLNGDGWPDLFDVTYCRGKDVETRLCEKQGVTRSCSPRAFAAGLRRGNRPIVAQHGRRRLASRRRLRSGLAGRTGPGAGRVADDGRSAADGVRRQ